MAAADRISYLLVGNPRSGTSVLSEALTSTALLGRPEEYFWKLQEPRWAKTFGLPVPEAAHYGRYIESALRYGTTPNGVFGAKLFWGHVQDLQERMAHDESVGARPDHELLRAIFGDNVLAVHVRRNELRAALSLWRAEASNVWGLRHGEQRPQAPKRLDVWRVTILHALMHAGSIGWPHLLTSGRIPTLTISYASISDDLEATVNRIARFVGVDPAELPSIPPPSLVKQADDMTDRVIAEWIDATGGCNLCQKQDYPEVV